MTELNVQACVAATHLENRVLSEPCGHIADKALIDALEMIGKLRAMRDVSPGVGNSHFVIIAGTDTISAVDAPEPQHVLPLSSEHRLRYLDTGLMCRGASSPPPSAGRARCSRRRFGSASSRSKYRSTGSRRAHGTWSRAR